MTRSPFPDSPYPGADLRTGLNARFKELYDAAQFPLTDVGGTADDVTASLSPALDGDGLLDGMTFLITWADPNTGGMTLAINGGSPVPVLGPDGLTLLAGAVGAGLRSQITYVAGDFVMVSPTLIGGGAGAQRFSWVFEASGTWSKPSDLPNDTPVIIQAWGGGGAGRDAGTAGGGGGGAFMQRIMRAGDLASAVTATVGLGGVTASIGGKGGDTTFGSHVTAYGGGGGNSQGGGGGGGSHEAGGNGGTVAQSPGDGGSIGGGDGDGSHATTIWGGGGGTNDGPGGNAVYGGAGGATGGQPAGTSIYGGNGGASDEAGQAPGGGGGRRANGARGEVRILI